MCAACRVFPVLGVMARWVGPGEEWSGMVWGGVRVWGPGTSGPPQVALFGTLISSFLVFVSTSKIT